MNSLTIQIVQTESEWAELANLLHQYAANDLDQPHLSSIWKDLQNLPSRYAAPKGLALIIKECPESQAIACGAFASTGNLGTCEIKRIYVQTPYRGQGIAEMLIRKLMLQAQQAGYTHAALSTWPTNHKGQALYSRLGFTPVAPFKEHPNPNLLFLGIELPRP